MSGIFVRLEKANGSSVKGSDVLSVAHLKCLVEVLHHSNPLACLLGKLGSLDLEGLHLMVQLSLVHVGLSHTKDWRRGYVSSYISYGVVFRGNSLLQRWEISQDGGLEKPGDSGLF